MFFHLANFETVATLVDVGIFTKRETSIVMKNKTRPTECDRVRFSEEKNAQEKDIKVKRTKIIIPVVIVLSLVMAILGCGGGGGGGTGSTISKTFSSISLNPASAIIIPGDTYELASVTVTATYDDASTAIVKNVSWSGTSVSGTIFTCPTIPGSHSLTCSYTENGVTKSAVFVATVQKKPLGVSLNPASATVVTGGTYNLASVAVTVTYEDLSTAIVTNASWSGTGISGLTFAAPTITGSVPLTCSYTEIGVTKTAVFTVNVVRPEEILIRGNFASMSSILENNAATSVARTNAFMNSIDAGFLDVSGTPNYQDLSSAMQSRCDRYTINAYRFTAKSFAFTATDTIQVTTKMYINIVRKPGIQGGMSAAEIFVTPDPKIIWKFNGTSWLIKSGLPYKSSELSI